VTAHTTSLTEAVERGAAGPAIQLNRKSARRWSWTTNNGSRHELDLRLEENWLLLTEPADGGLLPTASESIWSALTKNAASPTEVRTVLVPPKRLLLRSEILLTDEAVAEQRVRGVLDAFQMTWGGQVSVSQGLPNDWVVELEQRCEESGWDCVRRSSGRLTAALDTTPPQHATVTSNGNGVQLFVDIADYSTAPAACRVAAAMLALESSGQMRMVRAAVDENQSRLRFETVFQVMPSAEELAAGFSVLSVAVALTAESLAALQNEDLARDYLTIRGWSAAIENQQPERTNI